MKIYLDTETELFRPGYMLPRIVAVGIAIDDDPVDLYTRDGAKEPLTQALDLALRGGATIYAHHASYDLGCICSTYPDLTPMVFAAYQVSGIECTMLREMLIDIAVDGHIAQRNNLAAVYNRHTGKVLNKDDRQITFAALDDVLPEDWPESYRDYLIQDVEAVREIEHEQEDHDTLVDSPAQARAFFALHLASAWGITTDGDAVAKVKAEIEAQREAVADDLLDMGILRENGSKNMTILKELVEKHLGDATPRTAKGAVKTDRETVALVPELTPYAQYQADANTLNSFVPALERGAHEPLHPGYWMAKNGRATARGPNIQQMPRKPGVRECFVPRAGYVFVDADYSSMEMRTLAQVCLWLLGYSRLSEAINKGVDTHLHLAAELRHKSYAETEALYDVGDAGVKADRQMAKVGNFGFAGGMMPKTFVDYAHGYGLKLTIEQSEELREAWLTAWPEMREYLEWVSEKSGPMGDTFVQLVSGRHRGGCSFTEGANTLFSGLAADIIKEAVFRVTLECYVAEMNSPLYGSRLVAIIHDEIMLESPIELAPAAAERLAEVMVKTTRRYTPDIKAEAEPLIMDRWSKSAKPVRGDDGVLQVYHVA